MCNIGDLLVVHIDDKPSVYARLDLIEPDVKKDWWRVHLLLLTFPPQKVVWTLREEYINGTPFTMQGTPMQLTALPASHSNPTDEAARTATKDSRVVSLSAARDQRSKTSS